MPTWSAQQLKPWLETLHNNGIAAAPAEGMYGYVANPFSEAALKKVYEAKQRSASKGFIVVISQLGQLAQLCPQPFEEPYKSAVQTQWSGTTPTTLVLPALPSLPRLLTGGLPTIAVRWAKTPYMIEYIDTFGAPLLSTSLNLSGQPPATSAQQIPTNIPALTLPQPLSGIPSRIYNPLAETWLR